MTATTSGGLVVWFTGLPSSGKTTFAHRVRTELLARGRAAVLLDGDEVRAALRPAPGYDDAARDAFYETLARLAALVAAQTHIVLVAATANRAHFRSRAREIAPHFLEVFVDTPVEECRRRDAKGLYARAAMTQAAGGAAVSNLPGADASFERPTDPDEIVRPGDDGAVERVVARIISPPAE